MMFSLIIYHWSAMDGHSKREYEFEQFFFPISFLKPATNWSIVYDFQQNVHVTYHVTY